ncbi:MAG: cytochrome-c oxidase, cbb3-type subunit III [Gammaproteobacteria bacterium]|nr:cytochrome-c oxidase, cbb3-type subunit III [Gammaproteobacteria bacterium]NND38470.1 cytochrome-c oxidase, cbb3-type subunit III [Pseudomonadales bacterium]NNL11678.1 cytochrome-c oxidase, cbb3-type subunit III [Pseudomonadales bacterium]NNM11572.1 cytochrome-c oxidase, cbb3-type subunit III [Pseudomonadales bacterium]RZV60191.1 MAG: cytochrome-c oxidase, cbb3-type subunit III [Pseudomonadales bacterium]
MSSFWSAWIIGLTVISLVLLCWLLFGTRKIPVDKDKDTTGHVYDGIEEYDNPMPSWWINMFVISIVFGVFYLLFYPGLGNFKGLLNWTSASEWEADVVEAKSKAESFYVAYANTPIPALAEDATAMRVGKRIFSNNCATCHMVDGSGAKGYPNLTDDDWLYGGSPEQIEATLVNGRVAAMPAWESALSVAELDNLTRYVKSLSQPAEAGENAASRAMQGAEQKYLAMCSACHGESGEGNIAFGAPALNDDTWLYGGREVEIRHSIAKGRRGVMPAQAEILGEQKIHLLTAYVYQLSRQ